MALVDTTALCDSLTTFVVERLEGLLRRYLPDGQMPAVFAGFRNDAGSLADLIAVLGILPELNVFEIAGHEVEDLIVQLLGQVEPERCETFASYRIAEAIAQFGAWSANPLIAELDEAARQRVLAAIDSTAVFHQHGKPLGGRPRNYWAVLARCEHAREVLGVLEERDVFEHCLEQCATMLAGSETGFLDDAQDGSGRFDIYSAETLVFLEPLFDRLDRTHLDRSLQAHREQLELCADDTSGAFVSWGRSTGLISVAMTIELSALLLAQERSDHPERIAGLLACAFEAQQDWWQDDLVTAHRDRAPYRYRGPHRILQVSLDMLGKLAIAANQLRGMERQPDIIDPAAWREDAVDRMLMFSEQRCGVWVYRHGELAFQLPLVAGTASDYLPWPQQPGLLEVPSDSRIVCGLPVVLIDGKTWSVAGPPDDIVKTPGILSLRYDRLVSREDDDSRPAKLRIVYRANGSAFEARYDWQASGLERASICVPEAGRPLRVLVDGTPLAPFDLGGIAAWRSFWSQLKRLYQVEVPAGKDGMLQTTVRIELAD